MFSTVVLCAYFKDPVQDQNFLNQESETVSDTKPMVGKRALFATRFGRGTRILHRSLFRWTVVAGRLDRCFMWVYIFMSVLTDIIFLIIMLSYDGPTQHLELIQ